MLEPALGDQATDRQTIYRLALGSLVLSLLVWLAVPDRWSSDRTIDYEPIVQQLVERHSFYSSDNELAARYPPLFPLLLTAARMASALLDVPEKVPLAVLMSTCVAICAASLFAIGLRMMSRRAALLAVCVFVLHPYTQVGSIRLLSYLPFMALLFPAVLLFLRVLQEPRFWSAATTGVLLGAAMLVRPIGLLLPLAFALILVGMGWRRFAGRATVHALVLCLGAAAVVLPWQLEMASSGARGLLSTATVPALRDGLSFNHKSHRSAMPLPGGVERISDRAWQRYDTLRTAGDVARFLGEQVKTDPGAVVQLFFFKMARTWFGTEAQRRQVERVNIVLSLIMVSLGCWGSARLWRRAPARGLVVVTLAVLLIFWGMTMLALSIVRYMAPVIALLSLGVGEALDHGVTRISRGKATGKT